MPNENLTEIVCVLDKSGSMASLTDDTIGGFNAFMEKQRELDGDVNVTTTLFANNSEVIHEGVDLADLPDLDTDTYYPGGGTALMDALATTIDRVGDRLALTDEEERPGKVIVLVMTDGQENSSQAFSLEDVKDRVAHQQDKYNWEFVFIGANIDSFQEAGSLGFAAGSASNYAPTAAGTQEAWGKINRAATSYRSKGFKGDVDADLSDDEVLNYDTDKTN